MAVKPAVHLAEAEIPWLSDSEQRIWRRLLSVKCHLQERLDGDLRSAAGIGLSDYDVLVHLSEAPGYELRMSELASRLLLSRSGLTRRIDGLVRDGYVTRRPCEEDGRGSLAALTDAGMELLRRAAPVHVVGVRSYLIDPLESVGGLAALSGGLGRVERALGESGD